MESVITERTVTTYHMELASVNSYIDYKNRGDDNNQ